MLFRPHAASQSNHLCLYPSETGYSHCLWKDTLCQSKVADTAPLGVYDHFWGLYHSTLNSTLAAFHQNVDCPTRKNKAINLMLMWQMHTESQSFSLSGSLITTWSTYNQRTPPGPNTASYNPFHQKVIPWKGKFLKILI